jgi:hypothetical protein
MAAPLPRSVPDADRGIIYEFAMDKPTNVTKPLLDLKGKPSKFSKKRRSTTITADGRRFCHQIKPDEVFSTHRDVQIPVLSMLSIFSPYGGQRKQVRKSARLASRSLSK